MKQISNEVFCLDKLFEMDIKTKFLPSFYNDLPFLIIDEFIDLELCSLINKSITQSDNYKKAELKNKNIHQESFVNENIRKTSIYDLDENLKKVYEFNFEMFKRQIEGFFKLLIHQSTPVQVLEYCKGAFYSQHSDDSSMLYHENKLVGFIPVSKERKLTSVLFTTDYDEELVNKDSFYGGELVFSFLFDKYGNKIEFKPKAGQLIVFPSNPFFTHEVKIVEEGRRISLVQWHSVINN